MSFLSWDIVFEFLISPAKVVSTLRRFRILTILIQFQVSFLKVRRIQQSSQFEPCVVFFAAKVREFCRRVSNLILVCLQTLPKCVEDSPSQAGVKSCTKV